MIINGRIRHVIEKAVRDAVASEIQSLKDQADIAVAAVNLSGGSTEVDDFLTMLRENNRRLRQWTHVERLIVKSLHDIVEDAEAESRNE